MKTFDVLKASPQWLPGKAVGEHLEADEADDMTVALVSKGYLKEHVATDPGAELAGTLDALIGKHFTAMTDAISKANPAGRPRGLSANPGSYAAGDAEPKGGSLGEWVQCISACGPHKALGHDWHAKAMGLLDNRYKSKRNSNFGDEYAKSVSMDQGREESLGLVSKANVQVESVGSLMGFTVPPEYSPEIMRLTGMKSLFLDKVQRRKMTGLDLYITVIDYSTGATGVNPFLAGMTGGWVAEGQALAQTNMKLRQIHLKANTFGAYSQESRQLVADSRNAESLLTENFAATAAFYWDLALYNGNGVNQPIGMLASQNPSIASRTRTSGAGGLLADMTAMDAKLLPEPGADGRAFFVASPTAFGAILNMNDASGRVTYLPVFPGPDGGPATQRPRLSVLGYPLHKSQFPATSGTAKDIVLIDPIGHVAAIREDLEVAASDQYAFINNLITYRFLMRGDAQPLLNNTVTLQNSDVVAPYVYLN